VFVFRPGATPNENWLYPLKANNKQTEINKIAFFIVYKI